MSHVQHGLTPDQIAVKMARAIQYDINGFENDLREARQFPSKAVPASEMRRRAALLHGMHLMLSIALYGDDLHLPEAEAFVKSAPWKAEVDV